MSTLITVSNDEYDFTFKKYKNYVLINGVRFNTDIKQITDLHEKNECISVYKSLVKEGKSKEYAKIKASLFFAPYIEIGLAPVIELMDLIVLYLLDQTGLPELKKDMKIIVTDKEIYVFRGKGIKTEKYYIESNGSSHISYDYEKLLEVLINDANF